MAKKQTNIECPSCSSTKTTGTSSTNIVKPSYVATSSTSGDVNVYASPPKESGPAPTPVTHTKESTPCPQPPKQEENCDCNEPCQEPCPNTNYLQDATTCPDPCKAPCDTMDIGSPCPQDHTIVQNHCTYETAVRVSNTFNFPAIGETVEIFVNGVSNILPGMDIYNPSIGRLRVVSFDPSTSKLIARNLEFAEQAGKLISSCTSFHVVAPSEGSSFAADNTQNEPFLSACFTGIGNGNCSPMKVTTVKGLRLGDTISVSGFEYRINEILDTETIIVCDDGKGAPVGTVIDWDADCNGISEVPIVSLSNADPCSRDAVNMGTLIACEEGVQVPLEGTSEGQVLKWDSTLGKWVLANVDLPEVCQPLTVCLTIDNTEGTSYVTTVNNTDIYDVDDVVTIGEQEFTVTAIISDTEIRLTPNETPSGIIKYPVGALVCILDCCETLPRKVQELCESFNEKLTCLQDYVNKVNQPPEYFRYAQANQNPEPTILPEANFAGDSSSQVWVAADNTIQTGVPDMNNLPCTTIVNDTDCDKVLQYQVCLGITFTRVAQGAQYEYEIGCSTNGFQGFDPNDYAFNQSIPAGSGIASNVILGNTTGGRGNTVNLCKPEFPLTIPANSSVELCIFARVITTQGPENDAAISRLNNMPFDVFGQLFLSCAPIDCGLISCV